MIRSTLWRLEYGDKGLLAPGPWFWPRAIIWTVALFGFAVLAFFASVMLRGWLHLPAWTSYPVAILVPAAALGLYALAVKLGEQRAVSELALTRAPLDLILGGVIGFGFMSLSLIILWVLRLNAVAGGRWRDGFFYLIYNSYISGVLEELGFRAILLRLLARMFGPIPGLFISAALFALAHASHAPPVAVALLIINGGLLLGVLYMVSGSLWLPIGAHIAYDFTEWSLFGVGDHDGILTVTPSLHYPIWLTGGSFGPDGSVLSALVSAAFIAGAIWIGRVRAKRGASSPQLLQKIF
jgi:membrane protease YdiL (CAAX protease family)